MPRWQYPGCVPKASACFASADGQARRRDLPRPQFSSRAAPPCRRTRGRSGGARCRRCPSTAPRSRYAAAAGRARPRCASTARPWPAGSTWRSSWNRIRPYSFTPPCRKNAPLSNVRRRRFRDAEMHACAVRLQHRQRRRQRRAADRIQDQMIGSARRGGAQIGRDDDAVAAPFGDHRLLLGAAAHGRTRSRRTWRRAAPRDVRPRPSRRRPAPCGRAAARPGAVRAARSGPATGKRRGLCVGNAVRQCRDRMARRAHTLRPGAGRQHADHARSRGWAAAIRRGCLDHAGEIPAGPRAGVGLPTGRD